MMDKWGYSSTRSAAIVNAFWGIAAMMQFGMLFFVDAFLGNYWMALFSAVLYSFGLCLLSASIMKNWKILFFIALVILSGGISSSESISLDELSDVEEGDLPKFQYYLSKIALIIVHLVGAIAFTYLDMPYALTFWIPTICMVVATLAFCTGLSSYSRVQAQGSPLTTIFKNAYSRLRNWGGNVDDHQQQRNDRRFGRRSERLGKRRLVVCMTFFVLGVVSSIGETYFIEQADTMNSKSSPSPRQLQLLYYFAEYIFSEIYNLIVKRVNKDRRTYAGYAGVSVSMFFAIFCCFTAARMEIRRLSRVKRHRVLVDESDHNKTITDMTTFWLLPQYMFLGGLDGISSKSIDSLFSNDPRQPLDPYLKHFAKGVLGLGNIGSVLSVFIAGKASAWRDGTSWFGDTLYESRLDKYYLVLAGVSSANFVFYIVLYYWHDIWKKVCQVRMQIIRREAADAS